MTINVAIVAFLCTFALLLFAYEVYWVISLRRHFEHVLHEGLQEFHEDQHAALKEIYRQLHWVADAVTAPPPKPIGRGYDYSTTLRPMSARLDMRVPPGLPEKPRDIWLADQSQPTQPTQPAAEDTTPLPFQRRSRLS